MTWISVVAFIWTQIGRSAKQDKRTSEECEESGSWNSSVKDFISKENQQRLQRCDLGLVSFLPNPSYCKPTIFSKLSGGWLSMNYWLKHGHDTDTW